MEMGWTIVYRIFIIESILHVLTVSIVCWEDREVAKLCCQQKFLTDA